MFRDEFRSPENISTFTSWAVEDASPLQAVSCFFVRRGQRDAAPTDCFMFFRQTRAAGRRPYRQRSADYDLSRNCFVFACKLCFITEIYNRVAVTVKGYTLYTCMSARVIKWILVI